MSLSNINRLRRCQEIGHAGSYLFRKMTHWESNLSARQFDAIETIIVFQSVICEQAGCHFCEFILLILPKFQTYCYYVTILPAHIFFDDAFEISEENDDEVVVNRFVKDLMVTIDQAATEVHSTEYQLKPPKKFPTPYGGRLVWTLPGKTKMIAHLKDKEKIRHKKRWSQVRHITVLAQGFHCSIVTD